MGDVRSYTFPSTPGASADARRFAATAVEDMGWSGSVDDLQLLISELVTNAVVHADSSVRLTLYCHEAGIWVSVTDDGPGEPVATDAQPTDTAGRGLAIVARMSGAWGVVTEPGSKSVWFELPVST